MLKGKSIKGGVVLMRYYTAIQRSFVMLKGKSIKGRVVLSKYCSSVEEVLPCHIKGAVVFKGSEMLKEWCQVMCRI